MMRHLYERNIIEIKNEYTQFLVSVMVPLLNEGIRTIFNHAVESERKLKEKSGGGQSYSNPGILKIFQMYLKDMESLNVTSLEKETERIRSKSKCGDWFDDLVRAVIKSNIVLLTYNVCDKTCKLVEDKYHERINISDFIHKCYIECARIFYNNPEFVWHEFSRSQHICDAKKTKQELNDLLKIAVLDAIKKMLPMKLILSEYMANDYIKDEYAPPPLERFTQIKDMVKGDLTPDMKGGHKIDTPGGDSHKEKYSSSERKRENKHDIKHNNGYEKLHENRISTDDELDRINMNLNQLKRTFDSDTSDFTMNTKRQQSESTLKIDVEHPKLNK